MGEALVKIATPAEECLRVKVLYYIGGARMGLCVCAASGSHLAAAVSKA